MRNRSIKKQVWLNSRENELVGGKLHVSSLLRSTETKVLKDKANEISENLKSSKIEWTAPENIG